jgi:hypothetical protein
MDHSRGGISPTWAAAAVVVVMAVRSHVACDQAISENVGSKCIKFSEDQIQSSTIGHRKRSEATINL